MKSKFLYRKIKCLTRVSQNSPLCYPHFDYSCPSWYPNLNEKNEKMHRISEEEFRLINWLPTTKRVDQCINTITCDFINNIFPYYLHEFFEFAPHCRIGTFLNLKILFANLTWDKKQFLIFAALYCTACLTQLKKRIV